MAQQTFNLPYREEPYQVTATRKFYHPQTKTVSVNPTTPNPSLSFELVRKTGEWIYYEDSEILPYGRTVVEDINVEPEDSYISQPGVDGLREFSEEREWIDGEWTGEVRNFQETITQPVNEIYIQGTAVVTYEIDAYRTETITYTTQEYNSSDYFVGERVITQQGVNGVRTFYRSQKYVNGIPTGLFTGPETSQVTTQPVTHRIAIGTKPLEATITCTLDSNLWETHNRIWLVPLDNNLHDKKIIRLRFQPGGTLWNVTNKEYFFDTSDPVRTIIQFETEIGYIFPSFTRMLAGDNIEVTYEL